MNVHYMFSLIVVIGLVLLAYVGVEVLGLKAIFGVVLPYAAFLTFLIGVAYKVIDWAKSPVPFRITTTGGQQKSLPWIKSAKIDNPDCSVGVVVRMLTEILFFRSLFRNTKAELKEGNKFSYEWEKWLWIFAILFHWSFAVVLVRHFRLFTEPVPYLLQLLENLDGFFQIGIPVVFLSGLLLLAGVTYLFLRRIFIPQIKYISLAADYFPLFLIFGIAFTGILMRYFTKTDIVAVKQLTMGLVTLHPTVPATIGFIFYVHLFLVCVLLAYFPFSKLMHLGGIFLSPTRNLPGNTRAVRHINPWNYPVKVHTYDEYEEEFREKMIEAGLPVEKEE
ncbi:MAG: sulfate reduction electron transfer complex DsrMKJOP subunit DsrM [Desulfobacterales bacterium]|nr:sulfate reduction electron transfer complex DsrMKJOP subunit DsrM [Desulfobacterales bacterium]MBF0396264.1 sulfate reduction electron transfer complex DsrMKJOP subunit DsrM [Desulfobacterales bacterium]